MFKNDHNYMNDEDPINDKVQRIQWFLACHILKKAHH